MTIKSTIAIAVALMLSACGKSEAPKSTYREMTVANGGSIAGKITYQGTKPPVDPIIVEKDQDVCGTSHINPSDPGSGSGLAGVVVYIDKIESGKNFEPATTGKLDQHKCQFVPRVQLLKLGTGLVVSNSDDVTHNSHFFMNGKPIENKAQPAGAPPVEITLPVAGLHTVTCDVHPWMKGFVMVMDHPYYAITDSTGSFNLSNVPPGKYTIKVWRDSWVLGQPKGPNGKITGYDWGSDMHNQQDNVEVGSNAVTELNLTLH